MYTEVGTSAVTRVVRPAANFAYRRISASGSQPASRSRSSVPLGREILQPLNPPPILRPAVPNPRDHLPPPRARQHRVDLRAVPRRQREPEHTPVVRAVVRHAEARADEHRADAGVVEHPARGDGCDGRAAVAVAGRAARAQEGLEERPAAPDRGDHVEVLYIHGVSGRARGKWDVGAGAPCAGRA